MRGIQKVEAKNSAGIIGEMGLGNATGGERTEN